MTRMLDGLRVIAPVTQGRSAIAQELEAHGALVTRVEVIGFTEPAHPAVLDAAVAAWTAGSYDWLVVTSRVTVAALAAAANRAEVRLGDRPAGTRAAAVGASTAQACAEVGLTADLVPGGAADAEQLLAAFPTGPGRVLAPQSSLAAPTVAEGLRAKGWHVEVVEAYRTIDGPPFDAGIGLMLSEGQADALVLTSGSVARRLASQVPQVAASVAVIAIGKSTAREASDIGLTVSAIAAEPSPHGIVVALAETMRKDRS